MKYRRAGYTVSMYVQLCIQVNKELYGLRKGGHIVFTAIHDTPCLVASLLRSEKRVSKRQEGGREGGREGGSEGVSEGVRE